MSGCSGGSCSTCPSGSNDDPDRLPPGMLKQYNLNQSTADGVMVWVETVVRDGRPRVSRVSSEILAASESMNEGRLFAVLFGGVEMKDLYSEIFGYGVDTMYHVRDRRLEAYHPEAYVECMASIAERIVPAVILMGATSKGRELAPRLASMLGTGLTADCTGLSMEGRSLRMTRPAFGGNLIAEIECKQFPQMATVRQGAFPTPEPREGQGTAIYWQYQGDSLKDIVSEEPYSDSGTDIRDARVLISLGNGVRDRSAVESAEYIARRIGAQVSCSRALVEKGWMPQSKQVGQSGRTVSPDLYLAFGISGAVQHRAGMSKSGRVIAVNNNPDAPIHGFADLSILSDAGSVLKEIERSLRLDE